MKAIRIFLKRWLVFKPLYNIEKMINRVYGYHYYPGFSTFVYEVAKWAMN